MRFGMPWPGREVAREAEEAGVGAFCAGEFADHDAYLTVADIVANTERAPAGRVADGVIGHGLFTGDWWDKVVRPSVGQGTEAADGADRTGARPLEHGWVITAVDDAAPQRAIADARRMIAFYLTVKTYDPFVAHHGWEEPVARLRAAFRAGDTDGMARAVTDEMLTEIAVCGTTAEARKTLARRAGTLPR